MPKFSVIVPVLNEEKTLESTLLSLRNQTFKDFELIVVDNGSTDRSVEIARKYADVLLFEEKRGVINALKKGFSKAKGEIILSCDADTEYPPDYLERLSKIFSKSKDVVAVYGPFTLREKGRLFNRGALLVYAILNLLSRLFGVPLAGAANFAIRKWAYDESGGYDFGDLASQDFRLAMKLRKLGKVKYVSTLHVMTSYRRFEKEGLVRGLIKALAFWADVAFHIDKKKIKSYYDENYYKEKGL